MSVDTIIWVTLGSMLVALFATVAFVWRWDGTKEKVGAIFMIPGLIAFIGLITAHSVHEDIERRKSREAQQPQREVSLSDQMVSSTTTLQSNAGSGFYGWTVKSNGRTWKSAPDSAKWTLCESLARVSGGQSASYYYQGLNALFDTDDNYILTIALDDAVKLMDAGSTLLPRR